MTKALDKLPMKICKSKKHLYISYWLEFKPITYGFNPLIFHVNTSQKYHVAKELHLFLMILTFLQIDIQELFLELIENPPNRLNMIYFIGVNQNII